LSLTAVLFVAAALAAIGLLGVAWRRDLAGAVAGLPVLAAGAAVAAAGGARYATSLRLPGVGQEFAVVLAVAGLAFVVLATPLAAARLRVVEQPAARGRRSRRRERRAERRR
jgi:NADH:ubiquinone oxidoreductase subunit K